jgi:hypothetical protein
MGLKPNNYISHIICSADKKKLLILALELSLKAFPIIFVVVYYSFQNPDALNFKRGHCCNCGWYFL